MQNAARRLINLKETTVERLDKLKAIPSESYDSIIIRMIEYLEKEQ